MFLNNVEILLKDKMHATNTFNLSVPKSIKEKLKVNINKNYLDNLLDYLELTKYETGK